MPNCARITRRSTLNTKKLSKSGKQPRRLSLRSMGRSRRSLRKRLLAVDTTVEKLAYIEANPGNDRGLLWHQDELTGLIFSLDRYHSKGGAGRAALLELWNGGPRRIDRVREGGSVYVPNWSATLLGGSQFDRLKPIARELQDDGLCQRFLMFRGKDVLADGEEIDRPPNAAAVAAYESLVRKLVAVNDKPSGISATIHCDVPRPIIVRLSPEAQKYREEVRIISEKMKGLPSTVPALQSHLDKWRGFFPRLLLVLHAVECLSSGDKIAPEVPGTTAKMARDLMLKFFLPNASNLYDALFEPSNTMTDMRWIAEHILGHRLEEITLREIKRVYRKVSDSEWAIREAMTALVDAGWVMSEERGKQGSVKWKINPAVHTQHAERAAKAQARRAAEQVKISERTETVGKVLFEQKSNENGYVQ